jgi:hypothetical protein
MHIIGVKDFLASIGKWYRKINKNDILQRYNPYMLNTVKSFTEWHEKQKIHPYLL